MRDVLEGLLELDDTNLTRFSCVSRVICKGDRVIGHFSAMLIPNQRADLLVEASSVSAFSDPKYLTPIPDLELREHNRDLGSTLVLTSVFWDSAALGRSSTAAFVGDAVKRCTRWFEGNFVTRAVALIRTDYQETVGGLAGMCTPRQFSFHRVGDKYLTIDIKGEVSPMSIGFPWLRRLLSHPERERYEDLGLTDYRRLQARILHEFRYDVESVVKSGLIPRWNWLPGRDRLTDCCMGYKGWLELACQQHLDAKLPDAHKRNGSRSKRSDLRMESIQRFFAENPWQMTA